MQGPELVKWAKDKINAQEKLSKYLEEQSNFLLSGNTVPDWIEYKSMKGGGIGGNSSMSMPSAQPTPMKQDDPLGIR